MSGKIAEIEIRNPERAERIRAHDRARNKLRIVQTMAEIEAVDPKKAQRIRDRECRKRQRQRTDPATRAKYMRQSVKDEARRKGVKFDLSVKWFEDRLDAGFCEMSGLGFDLERSGRGTAKPNAPSIDRIVAGGHYVESNCRMILFSINQALSNFGEDYALNVFRHILARRGG